MFLLFPFFMNYIRLISVCAHTSFQRSSCCLASFFYVYELSNTNMNVNVPIGPGMN